MTGVHKPIREFFTMLTVVRKEAPVLDTKF
jgi:hypothetical protein